MIREKGAGRVYHIPLHITYGTCNEHYFEKELTHPDKYSTLATVYVYNTMQSSAIYSPLCERMLFILSFCLHFSFVLLIPARSLTLPLSLSLSHSFCAMLLACSVYTSQSEVAKQMNTIRRCVLCRCSGVLIVVVV